MTLGKAIAATRIPDQAWKRWVIYGWVLTLIIAYGPTVERFVFPVVSKFEVVSIEPSGVGSRVYVRFEKKRSCEFLGMTWEVVQPDGTKQRVLLNLKPSNDNSGSTRPTGKAVAGPWYVGMTPEQLIGHSTATIAYRCHPLWITEARVWP